MSNNLYLIENTLQNFPKSTLPTYEQVLLFYLELEDNFTVNESIERVVGELIRCNVIAAKPPFHMEIPSNGDEQHSKIFTKSILKIIMDGRSSFRNECLQILQVKSIAEAESKIHIYFQQMQQKKGKKKKTI